MLTLHKYNPKYVELFQKEKDKLDTLLNNTCLVEHIGSTAIPGADGKGVIDIMLVFNNMANLESAVKLLNSAKYFSSTDDINRNGRIFMSSTGITESGEGDIHLHLLTNDNVDYSRAIMFRNYLIEHHEARQSYNALKYKLLNTVNDDRKKYTILKDKFIKNIIELAKN